MKLRYLGFCGVDDSVPLSQLSELSAAHPWIEWGFLLRTDREGTPRYASRTRLQEIKEINRTKSLHLAAHLCGDFCLRVLEGDDQDIPWLIDIGFQRFQLNPTQANGVSVVSSREEEYIINVRTLISRYPSIEFILQANSETQFLWKAIVNDSPPRNMSILFDASCGTGVRLTLVPQPLPNIPCGYAGGISPSNLNSILGSIEAEVGDSLVWVDMESNLRLVSDDSKDDTFNLNACRTCIRIVENSHFVP